MLDLNSITPLESNRASNDSSPVNNKLARLILPSSSPKRDSTISNVNSQDMGSTIEASSRQNGVIKLSALSILSEAIKKDVLSKPKVSAFESRILGKDQNPDEVKKATEYCKEYPMHADLVKSILVSKNRTDDDVMTLYEKLRELPFFQRLEKAFTILTDNEAFLFLLRHLGWAEYQKGKFIGKENDSFDSRVFIINKGRVCISTQHNHKFEYQTLKEIDPEKENECLEDSFLAIDDKELIEEANRPRDKREHVLSPNVNENDENSVRSRANSRENSPDMRKKNNNRESAMSRRLLPRESSASPKKFSKDQIVTTFLSRKTSTLSQIRQKMASESSEAGSPLKRQSSREGGSESPKRKLGVGLTNPQSKFANNLESGASFENMSNLMSSPSPVKGEKAAGFRSKSLWKKLQANLMTSEENSPEPQGNRIVFTFTESPEKKKSLRKDYIHKYGKIVEHLKDGESFCEKALFTKQRRTFTAIAMTNVELITLSDEKFNEAKKKLERKKKEAIDFVVGIMPGLSKSPLFDPYAAIGMYSIMNQQSYPKGYNILTEGKQDNKFYIIFEGECEVYRTCVTQAYDPYNKLEEIKDNLIVPFTSRESHKLNIIRTGAIFGEEVLFGDGIKYTNTVKVSSLVTKVLVFEREKMLSRLTSETINAFKKFYFSKQENYFQTIRNAVQLKGYDIDPRSFYEDGIVTTRLRQEKILQSNFHSPSKVPFMVAHGVFKEEDLSILNQSVGDNANSSLINLADAFQSVRETPHPNSSNNMNFASIQEYFSAPKPSSTSGGNVIRVVSASVTRPRSQQTIFSANIQERRPHTRGSAGVSVGARAETPDILGASHHNMSMSNGFKNSQGNIFPKLDEGAAQNPAKTERAQSAGTNFFTSVRALKMSSNAVFKNKEENTSFGNQFRVMMDNEKERKSAVRQERSPSAQKKFGQPMIRSSENITKVNFFDQDSIKFRMNLLKEKTKQYQNIKSPLDVKFRFGDSKNKYEEKREAIIYNQFEKPGKNTPNMYSLDRIMQKHIVNTYRAMGEADSGLLEVNDEMFIRNGVAEQDANRPYYTTIAVGKAKKNKKYIPNEIINIHTINMKEHSKGKKRDTSRSKKSIDVQAGQPFSDIDFTSKGQNIILKKRDISTAGGRKDGQSARLSRHTISQGSVIATHNESHPTQTHYRANSDLTNTLKTGIAGEN